jgi:hypothetical protein
MNRSVQTGNYNDDIDAAFKKAHRDVQGHGQTWFRSGRRS